MTNIYEINKEYLDALEMVDEDGCMTDEAINILNANWELMESKMDSMWKFISNLEANVAWRKAEIDRLTALNNSDKKTTERVKKYIDYSLNARNIDKMNTDLYKFSYRSSEKASVVDEDKIPSIYKEVVPETYKINLTEAKKKLKEEIEARVEDAKADGKEYDLQEIKKEVYNQYWFDIIFNKNLQIK